MAEKYRLQPILTVRLRIKREASIALAKAIKELKDARDKMKDLEKERDDIIEKWKKKRDDMNQEIAAGVMIGEGNVHLNYLRKLKEDQEKKEEEIEKQKEVIQKAEEHVGKSRRKYIDACKALQTMEKHKELWEKKQREILTRKEEKEMDELGRTIHALRRWRGEKSLFENN